MLFNAARYLCGPLTSSICDRDVSAWLDTGGDKLPATFCRGPSGEEKSREVLAAIAGFTIDGERIIQYIYRSGGSFSKRFSRTFRVHPLNQSEIITPSFTVHNCRSFGHALSPDRPTAFHIAVADARLLVTPLFRIIFVSRASRDIADNCSARAPVCSTFFSLHLHPRFITYFDYLRGSDQPKVLPKFVDRIGANICGGKMTADLEKFMNVRHCEVK